MKLHTLKNTNICIYNKQCQPFVLLCLLLFSPGTDPVPPKQRGMAVCWEPTCLDTQQNTGTLRNGNSSLLRSWEIMAAPEVCARSPRCRGLIQHPPAEQGWVLAAREMPFPARDVRREKSRDESVVSSDSVKQPWVMRKDGWEMSAAKPGSLCPSPSFPAEQDPARRGYVVPAGY